MTAPNLISATSIKGKSSVLAVTTSATSILQNDASSGKCLKVNLLIISNIDTANTANITVDMFRSNTAYRIASSVTVPANASFDVFSSKAFYLEEGDSMRLTASANTKLEAVCSYEEIV